MYTPKIGSGADKEFIFFAVLFKLSIVCDIIDDVIGETCLSLTDFIERAVGQFRKRLASVIAVESRPTEQHFD